MHTSYLSVSFLSSKHVNIAVRLTVELMTSTVTLSGAADGTNTTTVKFTFTGNKCGNYFSSDCRATSTQVIACIHISSDDATKGTS